MNGDFSNAQAAELAARLLREAGASSDAMIARAFRLATGRLPGSREQELAKQFLAKQAELLRERSLKDDKLLFSSSMPSNIDPATGAALCDFALAIFNLPGVLYIN
jgi:hypothetical protein